MKDASGQPANTPERSAAHGRGGRSARQLFMMMGAGAFVTTSAIGSINHFDLLRGWPRSIVVFLIASILVGWIARADSPELRESRLARRLLIYGGIANVVVMIGCILVDRETGYVFAAVGALAVWAVAAWRVAR